MIGETKALENRASVKFAVCVDNRDYPASLELHGLYRVLPDEHAEAYGEIRVVDESGEDYLYPAEYFVLVPDPRAREVGNVRAWFENRDVVKNRNVLTDWRVAV